MLVELQCKNGEDLWHNGIIPRGSQLVVPHTINTRLKINICRCVCQALNDCGCSETLNCHFTSCKSIFYSELHCSVLDRIQKPFLEKGQTNSAYLVTRQATDFIQMDAATEKGD